MVRRVQGIVGWLARKCCGKDSALVVEVQLRKSDDPAASGAGRTAADAVTLAATWATAVRSVKAMQEQIHWICQAGGLRTEN